MPGKQMSIDADLRAGAFDMEEARTKRAELSQRIAALRIDGWRDEVRQRRQYRRSGHHCGQYCCRDHYRRHTDGIHRRRGNRNLRHPHHR